MSYTNKDLNVGCAVWGPTHFNWLKTVAMRSWAWPKNKDALQGSILSILTLEEQKEEIEIAARDSGIKFKDIEFTFIGDALKENPHIGGALMKEWFIREGNKCLTYNRQFLTAPPDTIFGDGSIWNMLELARFRDVVVLAAHMRVIPNIIEHVSVERPLTNAGLVSLAMKYQHRTWSEAESGPMSNSYVGGITWQYLDENLWALNHRLPTPYLINFTPEDLVYFKNQIHYGVIDHAWPGDVLVPAQRQRLIGATDCAFMVEITPENANIPPVEHTREDTPDAFWRDGAHNRANRMTTIIVRGE